MAQYRKRGTNVWQIIIYIGKDDEGKKVFKYETFYGTKTQAKEYGNTLESKIKYSIGAKGKDLNIGELFDLWLKDVRKTISETSYESYTGRVNRLKPYVGDLQLFDLSTMEVKKRLNQFEEELDHLSPRTIREHYSTLRTALNYAITMDLLKTDVMKGIKAPKVEHIERNVLNEEQIRVFLEYAKDYKHYLVIRILTLTGMRAGEVLGLKWSDINFKMSQLAIVRAANTKKRKLKDTKTKNSPREITLDNETLGLLKQHKKKSLKSNQLTDLIFQENGKPLRLNAIRYTKERILKKTGLQHIRLHDLRHGMGSIMLDNGSSITEVAETLGQVPSTTAGIYSHALRKGKTITNFIYPDSVKKSVEFSEMQV